MSSESYCAWCNVTGHAASGECERKYRGRQAMTASRQDTPPATTDDLLRMLIEEIKGLREDTKAVNASIKHAHRHLR